MENVEGQSGNVFSLGCYYTNPERDNALVSGDSGYGKKGMRFILKKEQTEFPGGPVVRT